MSDFKVGYARVNINPPLGIGICGYYVPRFAQGILDDLEASALALTYGDKRIVLVSVDSCEIYTELADQYRLAIEQECGLPKEAVFLTATHTHTGPLLVPVDAFEADETVIKKYAEFLGERLVDVVKLALADLKPAKMGYIVGQAPERVAYIRRYKMKDGSTWTCPPVGDPNIDHPIGEVDQRINMLRFDREGGHSVVLVNFGIHSDTVNGDFLSADFPGWMRKTVEKALDGTKCMFFPGAQGDVGSTNVHPSGGDLNDTEISFDNEMKSPGMARFVGRALAGTVLQVYDKVAYVDVDDIHVLPKEIMLPANVPAPEDLPLAHKYKELHDAGRDAEIPYTAMELTTVVAEALRMCRLEHGPMEFKMELTGIQIGPVALLGVPGELFSETGMELKKNDDWAMVLPCVLTNGSEGYFPPKSAYEEGGYEARTSQYKSGVAEVLVSGGKELLDDLKRVTEER
ncbi:MAG: hypothetical protein E7293_10200 [Lachnospiraceae bacterium]|nr:hypothetical protein [Lachnospiraceae bacterium]